MQNLLLRRVLLTRSRIPLAPSLRVVGPRRKFGHSCTRMEPKPVASTSQPATTALDAPHAEPTVDKPKQPQQKKAKAQANEAQHPLEVRAVPVQIDVR